MAYDNEARYLEATDKVGETGGIRVIAVLLFLPTSFFLERMEYLGGIYGNYPLYITTK